MNVKEAKRLRLVLEELNPKEIRWVGCPYPVLVQVGDIVKTKLDNYSPSQSDWLYGIVMSSRKINGGQNYIQINTKCGMERWNIVVDKTNFKHLFVGQKEWDT